MKENKNLTPQYIKNIVEIKSGIKDIGVKSRDRDISDMRHVYFALCWKFRYIAEPRITLEESGAVLGLNYATAIHGKNKFEERKNQKYYTYSLSIYRKCLRQINKDLKNNVASGDRFLKVLKTEQEHRLNSIEHANLRQKLVRNFVSQINHLKNINKSLLNELEVDCSTVN